MSILDFLFPRFCVNCRKVGLYLCSECEENLRYVECDRCIYCRRPALFGLTHPLCRRTNGVDGMISIFYYNSVLKKVLKAVKYRYSYEVLHDFFLHVRPAFFTKFRVFSCVSPLFFQPIPMHVHKLQERGFNQADEIALFFHRYIPCELSDVLKKHIHTPPQAGLSGKIMRRKNVCHAFVVKKHQVIRGQSFLLVDDVITTGATVIEAARVLKQNGASKVFTASLAIG